MAGDWIKVEHWTPDKPEVFSIAEKLGIEPDAVTGKLLRIWIWADQQTLFGDAASVTRASLDRLACVTGFANCMIDVGWLEQTETGLRFVNFGRHNGETAKQRALSAKRNAALRSRRNERDATSVTSASPKEEKRREEKNKEEEIHIRADNGTACEADEPDEPESDDKPESGVNPGDFQVAWNRCPGLVPIHRMTAKRKRALKTRSRDPAFIDGWQDGIRKIAASDFCCGNGSTGWRADCDWFLRPESLTRIMEGKYDNRTGTAGGNNGGNVPSYRGISSEEARLQRSLQACEDFARNG